MPFQLIQLISFLISALMVLIVIDVVIANLLAFGRGPSPYHPAVRMLRRVLDPILDPFRRLLPPSRTGGWDLSPMLVMVILSVVRGMLLSYR